MNSVRNKERHSDDKAFKAAVAAVALNSKTPFKTAFKVSMGIALAQLSILLMGIAFIAAMVFTATYVLR